MEIGTKLKSARKKCGLTQEKAAEAVGVSRQTISNWENDKSYPDINSLVLLSSLFGISLDVLVKGDLKEMEKMIREEDIKKLNRDAWIYTILLVVTVVSIVPLFFFLWPVGIGIWICIYAVAMYFAHRIEKQKKEHDLGTYKEIKMFMEGKRLDEIEKIREEGKRPYQKWSLALLFALIAVAVAAGICMVFDHLGMI